MYDESQLRGFQRIIAREVSLSDLLQHLSDLDPEPWRELIGTVPRTVSRERLLTRTDGRRGKGRADLALENDADPETLIEVKLGHKFTSDQRERYEATSDGPLILAGLSSDSHLISDDRWRFLNLADIFAAWEHSRDSNARSIAQITADTLKEWDRTIDGVFKAGAPLATVQQRFLAQVVASRIADELENRGWQVWAGVTSGSGGLPIASAWAPVGDDEDRAFIAEIRWGSDMQSGELRLGVDYWLEESQAARTEAWSLAVAMQETIRIDTFREYLAVTNPELNSLLLSDGAGRRMVNEDKWRPVIMHGFKSSTNPRGIKGGRRSNNPGFVGDGTQRFEAVSPIDYSRASAHNVVELLEACLLYLRDRVPSATAP